MEGRKVVTEGRRMNKGERRNVVEGRWPMKVMKEDDEGRKEGRNVVKEATRTKKGEQREGNEGW
jgi:hypothetical protein